MAQQSRAVHHSPLFRPCSRCLLAALVTTAVILLLLLLNNSLPLRLLHLTPAPPASPVPTYRPLGCACERRYNPAAAAAAAAAAGYSSCGDIAERRGYGQRVISFSVYGNVSGVFFDGISMNAKLARRFYPGWVVRVYHDFNTSQPEVRARLCDVTCSYNTVDFCDVHHLPDLGDISGKMGMMWRFMPLAEPIVSRFIVRDLDSLISQRERDAVDAWLASNLTFHVMRDHPLHTAVILGGMWGGWNRHNAIYRSVRKRIIEFSQSHTKGSDQVALRAVLWPELMRRKDVLAHDSYLCQFYPLSSPWPTQRHNGQFVGSPLLLYNQTVNKFCPLACRPTKHKDWEYC